MTETSEGAVRDTVLAALLEVAPDIDAAALDPAREFRDQFDFDSMDTLNFAVALHARLGVDVPDADYPRLATLDGCVRYVADALRARGRR